MTKEWNTLNLLRHSRHDWLNHLQLINGYLSVGRVDKVEKLVEEIVNKAKNESHLSNLNIQKVAEKLLTFNWEPHSFRVSFEVVASDTDWSHVEDVIFAFLENLLQLLDSYSTYGEDQHAMIMMNDIECKTVEIDFQGALMITEDCRNKIEKMKQEFENYIQLLEWNESECYVVFYAEGIEGTISHQSDEEGSNSSSIR